MRDHRGKTGTRAANWSWRPGQKGGVPKQPPGLKGSTSEDVCYDMGGKKKKKKKNSKPRVVLPKATAKEKEEGGVFRRAQGCASSASKKKQKRGTPIKKRRGGCNIKKGEKRIGKTPIKKKTHAMPEAHGERGRIGTIGTDRLGCRRKIGGKRKRTASNKGKAPSAVEGGL